MIRIGQLTDIHVHDFADLRKRDFLGKRLTGFVNWRMKRSEEYSVDVLNAAVNRLVDERPDLVLVTGDLSNLGLRSEWHAAQRLLQPLRDVGIRVGVIPGNHDYYVRGSAMGAFEHTFAHWQWADSRLSAHYPFVMRAGNISVLMMNSAIPTMPLFAYGRVSRAQLHRAAQLAEIERFQGQKLIVALHHHPIPAPHKKVDATRDLKDARQVRDLARDIRAELVLHGHNHYQYLRRLSSGQGPIVVGLSSGTTSRQDHDLKRGQVGMYTFNENGVQDIAIASWTGSQFSPFESVALDQIPVIFDNETAVTL